MGHGRNVKNYNALLKQLTDRLFYLIFLLSESKGVRAG